MAISANILNQDGTPQKIDNIVVYIQYKAKYVVSNKNK